MVDFNALGVFFISLSLYVYVFLCMFFSFLWFYGSLWTDSING